MPGRKHFQDEPITPEQNTPVQSTPPTGESANQSAPNPYRSKKSAKRDARTDDIENRLKNAKKERQLRGEERREKEERRRERETYRASHPGFYNPNLRIHGFFSVALAILALFVTLSFLLRDLSGAAGAAIAEGLLGCFSWSAYLLPIFMLVHAISWRSDIRDRTLVKKALAFLPALLVTSIYACILSPGFSPDAAYDAGRAYLDGSLYFAGGGAVGNFLGIYLYRTIGIIGISLIAIAVYAFFFALHFRTPVKIGYTLLRARIKEARVERAKRLAEEKEQAEKAPTERPKKKAKVNSPALPAEEVTPALTDAPERQTITGADIAAALAEAGIATEDAGAREDKHKVRSEKSTARRRAFFADLEEENGLDIERAALPAAGESRQLFDFESAGDLPSATSGEERKSSNDKPLRPRRDTAPEFGEASLRITRERIRPVRVTEPERAPEEAQDMDYFRKITVAADKREETRAEPWQRPAAATMPTHTPPSSYTATPAAQSLDTDDEADDSMYDVSVPTRAETPFTATSSLRTDLNEAARQGMREAAPATAYAPARASAPVRTPTARPAAPQKKPYRFPPLSLLHASEVEDLSGINADVQENAQKLLSILESFKLRTRISGYTRGPRITRYALVPEAGVSVSSIRGRIDDISVALATDGVRIAPISGVAALGVEVPNANPTIVRLRTLLDSDRFRNAKEKTTICLGVDVTGNPVYCDLAKMPHLLVAGATGMGKSVCVNSILTSILYKATPDDVKLMLIDPKKVEFSVYRGIPHLLVPVVTDAKKAAGALSWAVSEMERRYGLIEQAGLANIGEYNDYVAESGDGEPLSRIVIVIDELHALMIAARDTVEDSIALITAKARAAGIHLIIGTQRPSVDVITGTIKNNIPTRIAFHVPSQADSRTILDKVGAEKLLPMGDMLYDTAGASKPTRVQGAYVSVKEEISRVAAFLKENNDRDVEESERIMADIERETERCTQKKEEDDDGDNFTERNNVSSEDDELHLVWAAIDVGLTIGRMSTSQLQRKLSLGYGKAAKIMDIMEARGYITPSDGTNKPRQMLITREEFQELRMREADSVCGDFFKKGD